MYVHRTFEIGVVLVLVLVIAIVFVVALGGVVVDVCGCAPPPRVRAPQKASRGLLPPGWQE